MISLSTPLTGSTLEHKPCPLCDTPRNDRAVLQGRDLLHAVPGVFTVVQCQSCGLKRTAPRPTPEAIGAFYPSNYGPYVGTRVDLSTRLPFWRRMVKRVLDTKAQSIPAMRPGRLLEIGCASGQFLHAMAAQGWEVEGVEFSDEAANAARALGYPVETGALENIEKQGASYDLIAGWMVVEHLHEPVAVLNKLKRWSHPKTQLAISVPNAGGWQFRVFRERWYALQLPTHLFHFDVTTIRAVLAAAGWQVTRIQHQRVLTDVIASMGYVLQARGFRRFGETLVNNHSTRAGLFITAALFPLSWIAAAFGQTGRMTVWAKPAADS